MNVTLRQLHAFVLTAQLGSVTRAAERLHLTQSAVSVLIRQLETTLGVRLFDRTTRTLRLTAVAEDALPVAARMLRGEEELIAGVRGLTERRRGHVTIAVTAAVAAGTMPRALGQFRTRFPDIGVTMLDVPPDQLVAKVLNEDVELGIGTVDGSYASEIALGTLLRDTVGVVARSDSPVAARKKLSWDEALELPVIAVRKGSGIRSLIDATLAAKGKVLKPTWEVSFLTTALAMVAEGLGIAILSPYLISSLYYPALITRPLVDPVVTREISVITKPGRTISFASESFIDVMRQSIAPTFAPLGQDPPRAAGYSATSRNRTRNRSRPPRHRPRG
jgi:DNA-binding transcriptional LysR family regulator